MPKMGYIAPAEPVESIATTEIIEGVGNALEAPGKLYWICVTKEGSGVGFVRIVDSIDATTGGFLLYIPANSSIVLAFYPPWHFDTCIRCGQASASTDLLFGFIAD